MPVTLTWENFLKNCKELIEISQKYASDDWHLEQQNEEDGNTYLVINKKIKINDEIVNVEYHIIYSISYQVPVLYFRGYKSSGTPIGLEDAWDLFKDPITDKNDLLQALTQQDHPILFKPFLVLHPCKTSEILANAPNSKNLIVTFISTVGPFIRLALSDQVGMYFSQIEINQQN